MIFVCHMTLQDHVIKKLCTFVVMTPQVSHHLAKFGGHRYGNSKDIMIFVCHVISQIHVIKC